jgi:hypothetical protein
MPQSETRPARRASPSGPWRFVRRSVRRLLGKLEEQVGGGQGAVVEVVEVQRLVRRVGVLVGQTPHG